MRRARLVSTAILYTTETKLPFSKWEKLPIHDITDR